MVQRVKGYCHSPKDGLTLDESASIFLYSMEWHPGDQSFYFILNATLLKTDRGLLKPWFSYLRLIMTALAKLPSESKRFHVYRGVKRDLSAEIKTENTIVWWAFSSCTTSLNVLDNERYLGKNEKRTLFTIDCYSGKKIRNHTFYPEEDEVLLFPASQFKVIGYLGEGSDLFVVQLEEIQPKYPLINPIEPSKNIIPDVTSYTPASIASLVIPKLQKERLPTLLPVQRSLAALAKPVLQPIARSNNSVQLLEIPTKKKTLLHSIKSQNNPVQETVILSTKPTRQLTEPLAESTQKHAVDQAKRTQPLTIQKDQPITKSSCNNKKLLEQKKTFFFDLNCTNLDLRDRLMGDEGAKYIAKNLKDNRTLKTLNLWYNQIKDQGAQYLADSLKSNNVATLTLTTLSLSYNEIGHQGAAYIANSLQFNTVICFLIYITLCRPYFIQTLTELHISYNKIGDQGAQYLANALRNNTVIKLFSSLLN
ncbi:unnamed protein product [Rotaria sp. Silwood2]|nr:unnamed protein product [Rotaria sp. Silwood2]CAF4245817.1 unnamed protein product [Rotaria sp. Silwood2]